ncbi:MAG: hypothetical protein P8L83_03235 [Flavobacteriaceae bacterium]|nr:hypothetical protein [Flavobacteriaceae bacterium]
MQVRLYTLLIIVFIFGCSNEKRFETDQSFLRYTLTSSPENSQNIINTIVLHSAPSTFKNIMVDFDVYQVNYTNKNNGESSEIRYFTLNNGEIYRLGKGPDCIIFSKEIRWNQKGELISNFKSWYEKNSNENKLSIKNPKGASNISRNQKENTTSSLPKKIRKVICK